MITSDQIQHHAILIVTANRTSYCEVLFDSLSQVSLHTRKYEQTVLDIDTARDLISWSQTPHANKKYAILSFASITIPAQNALLKMLEEPAPETYFILITSSKELLLPTLISRLQELQNKEGQDTLKAMRNTAKEFLATAPVSRMQLKNIQELLTRTDEKGRKERELVRFFILTLTEELKKKNNNERYIQEVIEAANNVSAPSASTKVVMEYLALLLPVT